MAKFISRLIIRLLVLLALLASAAWLTQQRNPPANDTAVESAPSSEPTIVFEEIPLEQAPVKLTAFAFLPGTNEALVLDQGGEVFHYRIEEDHGKYLGKFSVPNVHEELDCGLLSVAIDPDFVENGLIYIGHCTDIQHSQVTRLTFTPEQYQAIRGSAARIIKLGDPAAESANHAIGSIGFDVEGNMWVTFGDKNISEHGQNPANALSAIVRINPNKDLRGSGYTRVPDNPFAGDSTKNSDIIAYGLRHPWRTTIDRHGRYWIADVGWKSVEELNLLTPDMFGANFGWAQWEGPCEHDCEGLTQPLVWYDFEPDHEFMAEDPNSVATEGRTIWVAREYSATNDRYNGLFTESILYGDFCTGWVRAIQVPVNTQTITRHHSIGNLEFIVDWDEGADGYFYAASYAGSHSRWSCPLIIPEGEETSSEPSGRDILQVPDDLPGQKLVFDPDLELLTPRFRGGFPDTGTIWRAKLK